MNIIGIGNALVDVILPIEDDQILDDLNLPKGSMQLVDRPWLEKIQLGTQHIKPEMASGGSAANTTHGLAALGVQTGFIGSIGDDEFGAFFTDDLTEKGIKPILRYGSEPTGQAMALVSPDSERTFGTFLGSAMELSPEHLDEEMFEGYQMLYIEGYLVQNHALIEKAVRLAKKAGLQVAMDLASFNVVDENREFLHGLLADYVDLVFANEEESASMTGLEPENAVLVLRSLCGKAVVKVGSDGAWVTDEASVVKVDAIPANPIDTSGAGDLFAAGYIYGLSKGLSARQCGMIGTALAGRVIEYLGPKLPADAWAKVKKDIEKIEMNDE